MGIRLAAPAAAEMARMCLRVGGFAVMTLSFVARIRCNRRNDGRGMEVIKLDEGVGDTFGLVRSKRPDFRIKTDTKAQ
jgi:hypothetical protein